ncbi:MAG: TonB-dependent receptor domain-containing protein [Steroidobacteraceae bacterium]
MMTNKRVSMAVAIALGLTSTWVSIAAAQEVTPPPAEPSANEGASEELAEIVVLGRNIPRPMVETAEVAAFIDPADLERTGDGDAAAALSRVSGLSLVSSKFVYVRGLGERYSAALLNGSPLPSPEPLQRTVPLDLFPSDILANVVVQKTYSPRYPGEFGGGIIDLQTVGVPEENFLSLSVGSKANSQTTGKDGLTYFGSETDFLGFDDGTRDLPPTLGAALASGKRIAPGNFTPAEIQRIGQSLRNAEVNLIQQRNDMYPGVSLGLQGGLRSDRDFGSVGAFGVVGFENDWLTRRGIQEDAAKIGADLVALSSYKHLSTQNNVTLNGLLGFGVDLGEHDLTLTNLYVRNTTKEVRSLSGTDGLFGGDVRDDSTAWFERELFSSQLSGAHQFDSLELNWRGNYAKSSREAPYQNAVRYALVEGRYLHSTSREQNSVNFSTVDDEVLGFGADLEYTLPASGRQDTVISVGGSWLDNKRTADSRSFRFQSLDRALTLNEQLQRIDYLLSNFNIGPGYIEIRETTGGDGGANYDAGLEVTGAFLQIDAEFIPLLRSSFGARYERGRQFVEVVKSFAADPDPTQVPAREENYVLPSATLTWNFYEDMQLRFGASKTIGRPQFRELAPQVYFDTDSSRLLVGNPLLVDTEILNGDLRWEWYFEGNQYLTLGGFFKKLDKPVESLVVEQGATTRQSYVNAPEATIYGAEIDFRKTFDVAANEGFWSMHRLFTAANYTWSRSEVSAKATDVVFPPTAAGTGLPANVVIQDGTPLQGHSEHLANVQLGVEPLDSGIRATLLGTYVGERISARGRIGLPDLVQKPGLLLDFVARTSFDVYGFDTTVSLEARNLLDENFEEFQSLGSQRVEVFTYERGRSYSLGLSIKF